MSTRENTELSADLVELLLDGFESVPELEALVLTVESTPRRWSSSEIASRLYLPSRAVESILGKLGRKEYLAVDERGMYYFDAYGGNAGRLERLVEAYRNHTGMIARLVHSKGSPALQDFLRAFDVKRGK